ncbi:MAG: NAD-dependent epimerase/dehydratase [Cytophagales bacterium CG12_big_fil_rev_8_21_14_0_65_40_12]|nr:MAG: NAD-dependent epimerase/dehydratase [Cytophagales bacterium CG12_big_fil_rev_8_21_14_0_65_40_12]PIW04249.1 MAG: NAD-dependent epimerase/dehydratase [Cytophagales bacterium CG17_big_fil_post_rev_8_21_14_2_50_40_13]
MKSILLIGGAGYVGSVLSSHLLKLGYQVHVLDNFVYDNQFAVQQFLGDPDYKITFGDFCDKQVLSKASNGVTDVIILGGLVGDPITKKFPEESARINEKGVRDCMDFFKDKLIDKLIFISTCSNYGLIGEDELANEEFALNPLSLYAKAKVSAEKYLMSLKGSANYTGVVLRFATAFGLSPRMRFDLSVSEFVRDVYFGNELLVYDEHTWRPYCHVRDFSRLISIVLDADNDKVDFEVFNAGGEKNNFTKKMIVDEIVKFVPDGKVKYGQNGGDPRNYKVDFRKVKQILDFEPHYSVSDGIKELVMSFDMGFYSDCLDDMDKYGNYALKI